MYYLEKIKLNIANSLNKALGKEIINPKDIIYPSSLEFGDFCLPCFNFAKDFKKTPGQIAEGLVGKLEKGEMLSAISALGPYLNFTINKKFLTKELLEEVNSFKEKYGNNESGNLKKVMIEFSNANTHKEYHVGHLRNISYGDAVNKIFSANGFTSIPVSYINDFGIHVAKTIWWTYHKENFRSAEAANPENIKNKGYFLGQMYAEATKKAEELKTARQQIEFVMKKIENRQGKEYKLWEETRQWSIDQFASIYKELGVCFENIFYESEFIDRGKEMINSLIEKNILIKSEEAVIADLSMYKLGVLVFVRSDGTSLYPVADLPLAIEKFDRFKIEESLYIVDIRQSLYFKQLFKIIELLGYKEKMVHLGYEFVKLPEGMMSSRTGNVITYEELRKEAILKSSFEIKKRHINWDEEKINMIAEKIVNGALKFEMLKVSREQTITFDINIALKFEGYTAAYLQYTYARIRSIFRNSEIDILNLHNQDNFNYLTEDRENNLIFKIAQFPEAIKSARDNYDPSTIAKYIFELAQVFNDYYHAVPILKAEEKIKLARLDLINSVAQVIKNGLFLLGIETVEEM